MAHPTSAALLILLTFLFTPITGAPPTISPFTLDVEYSGTTFFDGFNFFTEPDYTHGFVTYVSQQNATITGLIKADGIKPVYIGVDNTTVLNTSGPGRASVRISSKKTYTHGLFILDLAHMPGSICGAWPAFWMVGPNWPNNGEIDILEGVNSGSDNTMSLHSNANCKITGANQTGILQNTDCDVGFSTTGCGVTANDQSSYGTGFNNAGGGVYATEWTSEAIKVWFFSRSSIPQDIRLGTPDPKRWGLPTANLAGACDIDSHFTSHEIVFDTTFCGDWAGNVWAYDTSCRDKATTCTEYVANNPSVYTEAYWAINYLRVYSPQANPTGTLFSAGTSSTIQISSSTIQSITSSTGTSSVKMSLSSSTVTSSSSKPSMTSTTSSTTSTKTQSLSSSSSIIVQVSSSTKQPSSSLSATSATSSSSSVVIVQTSSSIKQSTSSVVILSTTSSSVKSSSPSSSATSLSSKSSVITSSTIPTTSNRSSSSSVTLRTSSSTKPSTSSNSVKTSSSMAQSSSSSKKSSSTRQSSSSFKTSSSSKQLSSSIKSSSSSTKQLSSSVKISPAMVSSQKSSSSISSSKLSTTTKTTLSMPSTTTKRSSSTAPIQTSSSPSTGSRKSTIASSRTSSRTSAAVQTLLPANFLARNGMTASSRTSSSTARLPSSSSVKKHGRSCKRKLRGENEKKR